MMLGSLRKFLVLLVGVSVAEAQFAESMEFGFAAADEREISFVEEI